MSRHYYPQYDTLQGQYTSGVELDFLRSHFRAEREPRRVADISGGGGRASVTLCDMGFRVVLTEVDPDAVKFAVQRGNPNLEAVHVAPGVDAFCFSPASLGGAICLQVPDLIENDPGFFLEASKILTPGAPLFVTITNRKSYKSIMRRLAGRGQGGGQVGRAQTNVYQASVDDIVERARDAGFLWLGGAGFNWLPFPKGSNSRLIPHLARLERLLGLRRLVRFSPWAILQFELRSDQ